VHSFAAGLGEVAVARTVKQALDCQKWRADRHVQSLGLPFCTLRRSSKVMLRLGNDVPLLAVEGLTKSFGALVAVGGVDLSISEGSIHALLGENGAGKSTLVKMLYGTLQPDAGRIVIRGKPTVVNSPNEARALGIGMVFQHFSLFESMSVAENIALALDHKPTPDLVKAELSAFAERYGLAVDPDATVGDLDVGVRQRVEILRVLLQKPSLVILDEPTSVLTPQEAESLFGVLRQLASEGKSILYISHKLDEVRALCDDATVMRHGKVVARTDPRKESSASLARAMVGSDVSEVTRKVGALPADAPLMFELNDVSYNPGTLFGMSLKSLSLRVHAGEIMGVAGVAGNGQKELFDVLSGEALVDLDGVRMAGKPIGSLPISKRRKLGAAFVPEERAGHASVPAMALSENALITRKAREDGTLGSLGVMRFSAIHKLSSMIREAFDVRSAKGDPLHRRFRAEICRSSWSAANFHATQRCSSSINRPGALMRLPQASFAGPSWTLRKKARR
jgi:ABC-type uncharacterized transport system ATPase subunit